MSTNHNVISSGEKTGANPSIKNPVTNRPAGDAQFRRFLIGTAILVLVMAMPLYRLFTYALGQEMYSYMVFMPVVTGYLINLRKPWLLESGKVSVKSGIVLIAATVAMALLWQNTMRSELPLDADESMAIGSFVFLVGIIGISLFTLGRERFKATFFPLSMLVFLIPIPSAAFEAIEEFFQYGSAFVTNAMFHLVGTTVVRDDLTFNLPNDAAIRVAPECSGIHSTYILLITSLLAGYLFLRSPLRRGILTSAVLPLALLRNGFRIFTIGELCAHYGMRMIDSWIHRKGGPFFFVLSLIPFFLLLAWLRSGEKRAPAAKDRELSKL
jgi:exosortase C (VPDSG-CTERM-specific)